MVSILDLFDKKDIVETNSGFKTECPCCGLQGGRTQGFTLFPDKNRWFCHSSQKHGGILELAAIQGGIIKCMECNGTGEKETILKGERYKEVLDLLEEQFDNNIFNEFLDLLKIRSKIENPGNGVLISDFANQVGKRFGNSNILYYRDNVDYAVEVKSDAFKEVKPIRFISQIERFYKPFTRVFSKGGKVYEINRSMNQSTSSAVLASDNFQQKLKKIERIFAFPLPIMYNKELTFPKKGYDERFNSWTSLLSPEINTTMSLENAKKIIKFIFYEFCFQTKQDYTNALAALLTPLLRGLYSKLNVRTPNFHYQANRERSGKTTCALIRHLIYEGLAREEAPISTGSRNDANEELRKKITAAQLSGRRMYHSSNNKGHLNSATYEALLTKTTYSDRILGKNQQVEIDNECDYSTDGNIGLTMTPDLRNRSVFVNLFLDIEDANDRSFKNPKLLTWVGNNRAEILSALYTLIRNWVIKKCPKGTLLFASYPEWAEICGGIMESTGYDNPCKNNSDSYAGISTDKETDEMKKLFELCYEKYPDKFITKKEIVEIINLKDEVIFGYLKFDEKSDQIKFGLKLNKSINRIFSDIRLIVEDTNIRSQRWKYKFSKQKRDFDKKEIFGDDFDEKMMKMGDFDKNIGHDEHDEHDLASSNTTIVYRDMGTSEMMPNISNMTTINTTKIKQSDDEKDRKLQFWKDPKCKESKLKELGFI